MNRLGRSSRRTRRRQHCILRLASGSWGTPEVSGQLWKELDKFKGPHRCRGRVRLLCRYPSISSPSKWTYLQLPPASVGSQRQPGGQPPGGGAVPGMGPLSVYWPGLPGEPDEPGMRQSAILPRASKVQHTPCLLQTCRFGLNAPATIDGRSCAS